MKQNETKRNETKQKQNEYKLIANEQSGQIIAIKGEGMPQREISPKTGDLLIEVSVQFPSSVTEEEKQWTDKQIDASAMEHFPTINTEEALGRPILFSNWTSKNYVPVDRETLREHTKARLRVFYEEELDVPLVLFNDVLDHVLRIDRVFRQIQGHLLLIGVSGSGKVSIKVLIILHRANRIDYRPPYPALWLG